MHAIALLAQSFHAPAAPPAAPAIQAAPQPGADLAYTPYRLPDGTIVQVDASAAKDAPTIGFTLTGGQIVPAQRVEP